MRRRSISGAKRVAITVFVIAWTLLFHYESLRHFYLNPLFKAELPQTKFLFPPAGWIMFYSVGDSSGAAEVWGLKGDNIDVLDPHAIFPTRWVLYDNVRRGILTHVLHPSRGAAFCRYMDWKFPEYDNFGVVQVTYPSGSRMPDKKVHYMVYRCR